MPVVVGSPFGPPASLAPLTSSNHECQPEIRYPLAMATRGAIDDGEPEPSREGLRGSSRETLRRSTFGTGSGSSRPGLAVHRPVPARPHRDHGPGRHPRCRRHHGIPSLITPLLVGWMCPGPAEFHAHLVFPAEIIERQLSPSGHHMDCTVSAFVTAYWECEPAARLSWVLCGFAQSRDPRREEHVGH